MSKMTHVLREAREKEAWRQQQQNKSKEQRVEEARQFLRIFGDERYV